MKMFHKYAVMAVMATTPIIALADAEPMLAEEPAPEKVWEASVAYDLSSQYIFRGVDLTGNNWLHSPAASGSAFGFSVWYWGGYGNSESLGGEDYQENDFGIDYSFDLADELISISAGYIFYHYPDGDVHDTSEVSGSVGINVLLSPTVTWYWDFDEIGGSYVTLGISHSFDLGKLINLEEPQGWTLDPSASLGIDGGYNSELSGRNDIDLNDILLGLSTSFQVTKYLEVHAGVNCSIALSALNGANQGNELWGVFGASVSF